MLAGLGRLGSGGGAVSPVYLWSAGLIFHLKDVFGVGDPQPGLAALQSDLLGVASLKGGAPLAGSVAICARGVASPARGATITHGFLFKCSYELVVAFLAHPGASDLPRLLHVLRVLGGSVLHHDFPDEVVPVLGCLDHFRVSLLAGYFASGLLLLLLLDSERRGAGVRWLARAGHR